MVVLVQLKGWKEFRKKIRLDDNNILEFCNLYRRKRGIGQVATVRIGLRSQLEKVEEPFQTIFLRFDLPCKESNFSTLEVTTKIFYDKLGSGKHKKIKKEIIVLSLIIKPYIYIYRERLGKTPNNKTENCIIFNQQYNNGLYPKPQLYQNSKSTKNEKK